ncbi:c-type cytochrome biogenesis protein CcsB [Aeromicrobium sp. CTD01-1L150]|uniref:c-type cytochrome biogenesis protein CcsB n=1 Tax=Aeromicrobium sp. CTD01-1L150 TaxID=3341830 RepID=UPI0035BF803D
MNTETIAQLSNYTVASGTIVVALAFLAHMAEWGLARKVAPDPVGVGGAEAPQPAERTEPHRSDVLASVGVSLTVLGTVLLWVGFITRGIAADRVPWGNMYEFGVGGSAIALTVYLVMVKLSGIQWLGGIVNGVLLIFLGMAMSTYVPAGPLVPSLHSYWLVIHVAAVMLSGAFFLVGAASSVLYLIRHRAEQRGSIGGLLARLPESAVMDQLAYRVNAVGFPLWTFGALIAGPIWAHYAWGRYWGWDPKEVWAFITWVVYAGYLHARATAGWKGKRAAIIAIIGFATFLFSYYGINLFGSGLHSYAK